MLTGIEIKNIKVNTIAKTLRFIFIIRLLKHLPDTGYRLRDLPAAALCIWFNFYSFSTAFASFPFFLFLRNFLTAKNPHTPSPTAARQSTTIVATIHHSEE